MIFCIFFNRFLSRTVNWNGRKSSRKNNLAETYTVFTKSFENFLKLRFWCILLAFVALEDVKFKWRNSFTVNFIFAQVLHPSVFSSQFGDKPLLSLYHYFLLQVISMALTNTSIKQQPCKEVVKAFFDIRNEWFDSQSCIRSNLSKTTSNKMMLDFSQNY